MDEWISRKLEKNLEIFYKYFREIREKFEEICMKNFKIKRKNFTSSEKCWKKIFYEEISEMVCRNF